MKKLIIPVFLAMALTLSCAAAFAHHGFGVAFDMATPVTQKGTVTQIQWTNPHVQLFWHDVKDARRQHCKLGCGNDQSPRLDPHGLHPDHSEAR